MELKSGYTVRPTNSFGYGSNCTFMELKWLSKLSKALRDKCSNCTFMELKLILLLLAINY